MTLSALTKRGNSTYSGDEFRSPLKGIELRKSDYRSDA